MIRIILVCFLLFVYPVQARQNPERFYQDKWCSGENMQTEFVLPDRARVDCLTAEYAVEVDFASKWAESIGQALYYANQTGKKPGILIIMENPAKDWVYLPRLYGAIVESGRTIQVWFVEP